MEGIRYNVILKQSYILCTRVKQSEFKKYLHVHGFCDAWTRLVFKFRSGMHEELGRHRDT